MYIIDFFFIILLGASNNVSEINQDHKENANQNLMKIEYTSLIKIGRQISNQDDAKDRGDY